MSDDVGPWARGRALVRRARTGLFAAELRGRERKASLRAALPGIADEARVREELDREARILGALGSHEAILGLGADESASSPPRLVLEGGDLVPLADVLAEGAHGIDLAIAVVMPLADALASAHALGIAHGRVSPTTVLVTKRGTPKLALFAEATFAALPEAPARDVALDDPAWLAPEVLMGEAATPAADVHALACLFVEIAAGRHPFAGEHEQGEERLGFAASLARVRDRLGPLLPAAAAAALTRALAKHPGDRQRDAGELLADLERSIAGARIRRPLAEVLGARAPSAVAARGSHDDDAPSRVPAAPFVALGLVLALGSVVALAGRGSDSTEGTAAAQASGRIRVLARPWAHVSLDGVPAETTPVGAPFVVPPGRHVLDFVHPSAPMVQRVVEVASGQTVVVDVILDVPPPPSPSASADESP